ncbi:MFS transporter, partial [Myxococcota bacterium]|nr:MFS transporter [Myxococcota bacterium]
MWGKGLGRTVRRMVDVRRDELPRVLPFVGAYAILLASLYILKPARNALFIHQAGVAQLPNVLMIVALVGGVAASLFARASKRLALEPLVLSTFAVLVAMLVGFRLLLTTEWVWVYYAFYVWVSLFGLVATSLVWLLANAAFDHREARRVFGLIGTGGIAGAILGGLFTGRVVEHVGTNDLLIICAFFVVCAMALLKMVTIPDGAQKGARRAARDTERAEERGTLGLITRSPLLVRLALLSWVIAIVSVAVEIQFNEVVDRTFTTTDAKTAFFGEMLAWLSAFAFLFQLFATPRILRAVGVGPALLFLPASLAIGSAFMLVAPGLLAAIALKVGDGGFRHSIHKSATEVVFLPVPGHVKRQVKLFLDTTVDTTGTGIGALVALGITAIGVGYGALGWLSIALVGVASFLALGLRGAYVDAFRSALEQRELDLADLRLELRDASTVHVLLPALKSTNERQLVYALDVLSSAKTPELHAVVRPLLTHPSAEVRRRAATALAGASDPASCAELERLLDDADHEVRAAAIAALALAANEGRLERLRGFLASPDARIR